MTYSQTVTDMDAEGALGTVDRGRASEAVQLLRRHLSAAPRSDLTAAALWGLDATDRAIAASS